MATATAVSVDEYLATAYRPECDYVEGEVRERNMGEHEQSRLQMMLAGYLWTREKAWNIHVVPEQRVQVRPNRFRVPDICVTRKPRPEERIFTTPPLLCIEILSPEDTVYRMQERIDDYLAFGVPYVWVLNPSTRRGWIHTAAGVEEASDGMLRADTIEVPIQALFD